MLECVEPPSGIDTAESTPPSRSVSPNAEDGIDLALYPSRQEFSLPPVDGGKDAWLFLAAGFVFEALVWGIQSFPSTLQYCANVNYGYLTLENRVPLLLRCFSRLLYNYTALSWQSQYRRYRNLCHGSHVPPQPIDPRSMPAVRKMGSIHTHSGFAHHVHSTGSLVVLHNRWGAYRNPGYYVRHWREHRVFSLHLVH